MRVRIATGLIGGLLVVLAIFWAPADLFFVIFLVGSCWAAGEYVRIVRRWTPSAPLAAIPALVALAGAGLYLGFRLRVDAPLGLCLIAGLCFLLLSSALVPLLGRTKVEEGPAAIGFIAFGVPYFALAPVSLSYLKLRDPWLLFLLLALVVLGDSAAYFIGTWLGRHKLAPVVSPNKTWEGAAAGFFCSLATTAVWSLARSGELRWGLVAVAAVTAVAAQLGDLTESLLKRAAGVKDSASILPGHGGMLDRADATLFAAPVFVLGLWLLEW